MGTSSPLNHGVSPDVQTSPFETVWVIANLPAGILFVNLFGKQGPEWAYFLCVFIEWLIGGAGLIYLRAVLSKPPPCVAILTDPETQKTIVMFQREVITVAEQKLGRSLTDAERFGIQNIRSLMMLESCLQSFTSPNYTPAEISNDLESFAKKVPPESQNPSHL